MSNAISNSDNLIDSRDVIARIEELQAGETCDECNGSGIVTPNVDEEGNQPEDEDCPSCQGRGTRVNDDDADELKALEALAEEAEGYCDWTGGATLVADSYFERYAEQLAEDIGAIDRNATWPLTCID